ncbi:M1-specific T cell receptor alpha chain-like [Ictalurus furcatus]|uniref:M1-specific T cell receptor alpha chain-like n=1 Tax=Ictalurus furcatus TaxID=66913 RepID=UPI00235046DD|nr:M1-specific T cell receptor alpha chain-like [Ictalurus furcatus]
MSVIEGSNTTLSCTYTGSAYSLHWYRQKPGSRPEFLLLIDKASEHVTQAQPPHPHLSIKLDEKNTKVDLLISSVTVTDSALYYCALRPTVTGKPTTLCKKHYTYPPGLNALHDSIPPHLSVEVNEDKQVDLLISSAVVSDSALYYCALEPTVTGNSITLYKNFDQFCYSKG